MRLPTFLCAAILLASATQAFPQITLSATPSSLTFTYVIGATTLPVVQATAIKRSGSGTALDFSITVSPLPSAWLIFTPPTGKTGTSVSVRVNPTSLIAGTYAATLQVDAVGATSTTVIVVLVVKNPPPTMTATPGSLAFAWLTASVTPLADQTITLSTNGEPFSFTATATGGTWLSVTPTVGVVLSGSPLTLTVKADTTGLVPGPYPGKIALTSATAANKTVNISVTLTVGAGTAVIDSIWPGATPINSNDTIITVRGSNLFKATVIKAGATNLTATWISSGVLLATVPKAMLTTAGNLAVIAVNSPQPDSNSVTFTVTPPGPTIQTVVNAASFFAVPAPGKPTIAPGEIISIFGAALGPAVALLATPVLNAFPTTLGTPPADVLVEFETSTAPSTWVAAPLIFVQANQINCQVPFTLPTGTDLKMRVTYNALTSADFLFDGVAADPGLFTVDSSGRGQAAALNFVAPSTFSLNSAANPVSKGGVLVLYLTGAGAISTLPVPEGQLTSVTPPVPTVVGAVSVKIGVDAATVASATAVPGALGGLVQLNVNVPSTMTAGKELPLMVTIGGKDSPVTATVSVK